MIHFPSKLTPANTDMFKNYLYHRTLCYLRQEIYEFMLCRKDEKMFFDYDGFSKRRDVTIKLVNDMVDELVTELNKLGWSCQKAYGNTALYIIGDKNVIQNMSILN